MNHNNKNRSLLKICGLTQSVDLSFCVQHGVDYVGFNFFPGSKRWIDPSKALDLWQRQLAMSPSTSTVPVGVFVGASYASMVQVAVRWPQNFIIQLHGSESMLLARRLRLVRPVWKALPVLQQSDLDQVSAWGPVVDLVLLDAAAPKSPFFGGGGHSFAWKWLGDVDRRYPFGLAGGVGNSNIEEALAYRPHLVDICSGCELQPGKKDHQTILALMEAMEKVGRQDAIEVVSSPEP